MNTQPLPVALADVLARGDVWRGDTLAALPETTIPSGHAELDAELPGGGWPRGNLTELLVDQGGVGEMSLLLPALAHLSAAGGWLALVAPPWQAHAPAWQAAGIALERLVVVRAGQQVGWCVEQLLACGGFAGVLAWPEAGIALENGQRRLQSERRRQLLPGANPGRHRHLVSNQHPPASDNGARRLTQRQGLDRQQRKMQGQPQHAGFSRQRQGDGERTRPAARKPAGHAA